MPFDITPYAKDIEAAIIEGGDIWKHSLLEQYKQELKSFCRTKLNEQCCYCRKNTHGEFKFVLDIEHILPKGKFAHLMFTEFNLSMSCKRCNMNCKRDDTSFVTDLVAAKTDANKSALYKFIHPNLDAYFDHIKLYEQTINDKKIVKYQVVNGSEKGQFTFSYFRLSELEIDTINAAQGVPEKVELSDAINAETQKKIEDLLRSK